MEDEDLEAVFEEWQRCEEIEREYMSTLDTVYVMVCMCAVRLIYPPPLHTIANGA